MTSSPPFLHPPIYLNIFHQLDLTRYPFQTNSPKMSFTTRLARPVTSLARRGVLTSAVRSKHTLPDLPYDYGALEPAISGKIMEACNSFPVFCGAMVVKSAKNGH
jgi:Iron/manganese superoxide dismutases, alpha-hairpin domain